MKKILSITTIVTGLIALIICGYTSYNYYISDTDGIFICVAIGLAMIAAIVCFCVTAVKKGLEFSSGRMLKAVLITVLSLVGYNVAKSLIYTAITAGLSGMSVDFSDVLVYNGGIDFMQFLRCIPDIVSMGAKEHITMQQPVLMYAESLFEMFAIHALIGELVDDGQTIAQAFRTAMLDKLGFIPVVLFVMRMIVTASNFSDNVWIAGITMVYPLVFIISLAAELLEYSPIAILNVIPICMARDAIIATFSQDSQLGSINVVVLLIALVVFVFVVYWISSAIEDYCNKNEGSVGEKILTFTFDRVMDVLTNVVEWIALGIITVSASVATGSEVAFDAADEYIDEALDGYDEYYNQ